MTKKTTPIADERLRLEPDCYPIEELVSSGLLWLINSTVFWPRGFALALEGERRSTENGPDAHKVVGFLLVGDGSEPITASSDEISQRRFEASEALFERLRFEGIRDRAKGVAP